MAKQIGMILSGCGVYDGSEIHESVLTILALKTAGAEVYFFAPDVKQYHVINHLNGEEMKESRNVLTESARIARGDIKDVSQASVANLDGLILPGGFGTAKNITTWAFNGPAGEINADVKKLIVEMVKAGKPVAAICMSPTTIAKALEGSGINAQLTVGTTASKSPYDIKAISEGINATGAAAQMCEVEEVVVDEQNKIITSPCYMMEADIVAINKGIIKTVTELMKRV